MSLNTEAGLAIITNWISSHSESPHLVIIAGGTCSGKSYFSRKISDYYSGKLSLINLDNYFLDINDPQLPTSGRGLPVFDLPDSYHKEEFVQCIHSLLQGKYVFVPTYDIASNKRIGHVLVEAQYKTILAEGLFTISFLKKQIPNSLCVYMEASNQTCLERRISRDTTKFNIPSRLVEAKFASQILPLQKLFVEPQKFEADIIINT